MNSALIIGIVLIIAGIALAVVAYMVITSGDEEEEEDELQIADEPVEVVPGELETEAAPTEEQLDEESPDAAAAEMEASPSVESALMEAPSQESASDVEQDRDETSAPEAPEAPDRTSTRIQVATLMRDDVTGKLIIKVGDREYTSPDDLRSSPDWIRIEYAASDLSEWVQRPQQKSPSEKETAAEGEGQVADHKPSTMIEQINAILQERIESSGRSELAVRLIEGPGGMARVLIGVHSYELAEVPDPEVQELIREAVATWEATQ
ncbi:MAG: hypothetical protein PVI81_03395 [Anaerolineales bacterium]|jgi:type IV secretory pathway VirB10-like protein